MRCARNSFRPAFLLILLVGHIAIADEPWTIQPSGVTARLRGLAVVNEQTAWASGAKGTVLRTTDGGDTWRACSVPGASELDFRDIHAFSADQALLLSIGPGAASRVYVTRDGGVSWTLAYQNRDNAIFLDAVAFADDHHGLMVGDPVDGRFVLLATNNAGATWRRLEPALCPPALPGEAAFAASGTCLIAGPGGYWLVTGGADKARVHQSPAIGRPWTTRELPVAASSPSAGAFSIAASPDGRRLVVVGGDFQRSDSSEAVAAWSHDAGQTWNVVVSRGPRGYRSAVAFVNDGANLVVVGPTGADFSTDGGRIWKPLGDTSLDALDFADASTGWAVGESGRIARFRGPLP